jgi:hypothetical protein
MPFAAEPRAHLRQRAHAECKDAALRRIGLGDVGFRGQQQRGAKHDGRDEGGAAREQRSSRPEGRQRCEDRTEHGRNAVVCNVPGFRT